MNHLGTIIISNKVSIIACHKISLVADIFNASIIILDTCDSVWQSTRNNLIISAFVFSLLSFLIFVAIVVYRGELNHRYTNSTRLETLRPRAKEMCYHSH